MKPHPRILRTFKWGGLASGLLLAAVSVGSVLWHLDAVDPYGNMIGVGHGRFGLQHEPTGAIDRPGVYVYRCGCPHAMFCWWFGLQRTSRFDCLVIPLWVLTASALLSSAAAWRLGTLTRRRLRTGCCPGCGYDRRGLAPGAVCPECGGNA